MAEETRVPVLVVGAGPVGLTLAIDLGRRGISCLVVDKREAPGFLPKMERCNARTMEHFRRLGIADRVRGEGFPAEAPMDVFVVRSLAEKPWLHHPYPSVAELRAKAATCTDGSQPAEPYQLVSQYRLEPLLRDIAGEIDGVRVAFDHELIDLVQHPDRVEATVRAGGGRVIRVHADYLAGCDGGSSRVRDLIGARLAGEADRGKLTQALYRADDLYDRIPIGRGRHYHVVDEHFTALVVQGDRRHFSLHSRTEDPDEMDARFRQVVGFPVTFERRYAGSWTMRLMLADRYADRRVFLAGDAAHLVIPTGGLGMNTGVGDAIDLAWKLAFTIQGRGGPGLLASYETERRPIGARNIAASRAAFIGRSTWRQEYVPEIFDSTREGATARRRLVARADVEQRKSNDLLGIELGYRYTGSPLIIDDGLSVTDHDSFTYTPTTDPGVRIPHAVLDDGMFLCDVLGLGFSLIAASGREGEAGPWRQAFARLGVDLAVVPVPAGTMRRAYGHDFLLVRPDLHVAWRGQATPAAPEPLAAAVSGHHC